MNQAAQALADALAGNVRLRVAREAYTQAHVRNLLMAAGVPVIWERTMQIRVARGTLTTEFDARSDSYQLLWQPGFAEFWEGESDGIAVPVKAPKPKSLGGWKFGYDH